MKLRIITFVITITLFLSSIAIGQNLPQKISFQGHMIDTSSGKTVTGEKNFTFKIGDWIEEHTNVKVNNGLYSVILGSYNPMPLTLFNDWPAYLKIFVDGKEMAPDIEMLSVPYAVRANQLDNVYCKDGKVGIGVLNPKYAFHVKGPSVFSGNIGFNGTDPSTDIVTRDGFRFKYDNNFFGKNLDAMIFEKTDGNQGRPDGGIVFVNRGSYGDDGNPVTAMVIKGDGKIGIGTTNPMGKLHIRNMGDDSDQYSGLKFYPATSAKTGIHSYHRISGFRKNGLWLCGSGNGSSFAMSHILLKDEGVLIGMSDSHKNPEENIKLSILNNGKVIISDSLEIKGSAIVRGNIGLFGTDPDVSVPNDGFRLRYNGHFFGKNLDAMVFEKTDGNQVNPDGGIAFVNRGKDGIPEAAMVIKGNGNIGIGTLSPTHKLHINGSAYCTSGTWTASDIRFKKNIRPIQNVLPKITLLQSVSYDLRTKEFPEKNFPQGKQIGFIANEVEKVYPELVQEDDEGIRSIAYNKISVLNVEAIKELYQLVQSIQEQNQKNKMAITKLEAENARLKREIFDNKPNNEICLN